MQKRITKIEIENYRAFFGPYSIALEKGENLLVYGENGSGKSSFYHALKDYFEIHEDGKFFDSTPMDEQDESSFGGYKDILTANWYSSQPNIILTFTEFENGKATDGTQAAFPIKEKKDESEEKENESEEKENESEEKENESEEKENESEEKENESEEKENESEEKENESEEKENESEEKENESEEEAPITSPDRSFIQKINLAKGFFSYRELLATHLDGRKSGELDLFNILAKRVLRDYKSETDTETIGQLWDSLVEENAALIEIKEQNPLPDAVIGQTILDATATIKQELDNFNDRLEAALVLLEADTNAFSKEFNHGLNIEFEFPSEEERKNNYDATTNQLTAPEVYLKVSYNDFSIVEHHQHLNEARLSSLAISIFLASVINNPTKDILKILFLDDIFLGLDTGNRLPLLKILSDKQFEDFQIFLTTYDRAWFDLAKDHLHGNWKTVEMYAQEDVIIEHPDGSKNAVSIQIERDGTKKIIPSIEPPPGSRELKFERPLIIDPSLGYLEKARLYFEKKDYPTCANYQRKWCEQFLKNYLQENHRLEIGTDETAIAITKLETLFNKLKAFYRNCGLALPEIIEKGYPRHRDTVMNPFSHDDLLSPVYRVELEQGFILIDAFQKLLRLRRGVIAYQNDIIEYVEPSVNYLCRFKITTEPLTLVLHGNTIKVIGRGDVIEYIENGTTNPAPSKGMTNLTIDDFYDKIRDYLTKKHPGFCTKPK